MQERTHHQQTADPDRRRGLYSAVVLLLYYNQPASRGRQAAVNIHKAASSTAATGFVVRTKHPTQHSPIPGAPPPCSTPSDR